MSVARTLLIALLLSLTGLTLVTPAQAQLESCTTPGSEPPFVNVEDCVAEIQGLPGDGPAVCDENGEPEGCIDAGEVNPVPAGDGFVAAFNFGEVPAAIETPAAAYVAADEDGNIVVTVTAYQDGVAYANEDLTLKVAMGMGNIEGETPTPDCPSGTIPTAEVACYIADTQSTDGTGSATFTFVAEDLLAGRPANGLDFFAMKNPSSVSSHYLFAKDLLIEQGDFENADALDELGVDAQIKATTPVFITGTGGVSATPALGDGFVAAISIAGAVPAGTALLASPDDDGNLVISATPFAATDGTYAEDLSHVYGLRLFGIQDNAQAKYPAEGDALWPDACVDGDVDANNCADLPELTWTIPAEDLTFQGGAFYVQIQDFGTDAEALLATSNSLLPKDLLLGGQPAQASTFDTLENDTVFTPVVLNAGGTGVPGIPEDFSDLPAAVAEVLCGLGEPFSCPEGTLLVITVPGDVADCVLTLASADGDYGRYYLYSDLDGDGTPDLQELAGDGDGNALSSCNLGGPTPGGEDSDGDGLDDADEDANGNFVVDDGETDPQSADTDADGLTDCQETGYAGATSDFEDDADCPDNLPSYKTSPTVADSDGDGLLDGTEQSGAGASPVPAIPAPVQAVLDSLCLDILADPFNVVIPPTSSGTFPDCVGGGPGVDGAQPNPTNPTDPDTDDDAVGDGAEDANQDGLKDATESDPNKPDTDGDTLADGTEDADHDGAKDATETSAVLADTDVDGLNDCQETGYVADSPGLGEDGTPTAGVCDPVGAAPPAQRYHTGALTPDSDGDAALDGDEVATGHNPTDADDTPIEGDTDGDGVSDEQEITDGTDPANPDTDGDTLTDCQETGYVAESPNGGLDSGYCPDPSFPYATVTDMVDPAVTDAVNGYLGLPKYHTSPLVKDSDGDFVDENVEIAGGFASKPDGNSVVGIVTNPTDSDSDNDSLIDGHEIGPSGTPGADFTVPFASDPLVVDTDGDVVPDDVEVRDTIVGVHAGKSKPNDFDSDDDGLSDCQETGFVAQAAGTSGFNEGAGLFACTPKSATVLMGDYTSRVQAFFTDPMSTDSDGDLIRDCIEQGYVASTLGNDDFDVSNNVELGTGTTNANLNTASSNAICLPYGSYVDGDGVTHHFEVTHYRTNPARADSDSDGDDDRRELDRGTNPTHIDTDGDLLTDCQEVGYVLDANPFVTAADGNVCASADQPGGMPMDGPGDEEGGNVEPVHYLTSPTRADSDRDGRSDSFEIVNDEQNGFAMSPTVFNLDDTVDGDGDGLVNCRESLYDPSRANVAVGANPVPTTAYVPGQCIDAEGGIVDLSAFTVYVTNKDDYDSDNDDLADLAEILGGGTEAAPGALWTNPTVTDTDADGLVDCAETGFTGPTDAFQTGSANNAAGPCNVDRSPSDGFQSSAEYATHPRMADSDLDGVLDGPEVNRRAEDLDDTLFDFVGRTSVGRTNPTKIDTDGDLLTDCQETAPTTGMSDPLGGELGTPTFTLVPVTPDADPVNPAVTCPILPGNVGGAFAYDTDPLQTDSDAGTASDGAEVAAGGNPTLAVDDNVPGVTGPADDLCASSEVAEDCAGLVTAGAGAGPAIVLNTVRLPNPTAIFLEQECNFLAPTTWNTEVEQDDLRTDPAAAAANGAVDWYDEDGYLLWDGDACNDIGDPKDEGESAGSADENATVYNTHLFNYIVSVATGEPPSQDDVAALVEGLAGDAYTNMFVDRLDPADINENGITLEPNGQPDAIEQQLLIVDPHGAVPLFPLMTQGDDHDASPITANLPEDVDGITLVLRNPARGGQLAATVSLYVTPQVIVEAFNGASINSVCIGIGTAGPSVGLAPGRFDDETCDADAQGQVEDALGEACADAADCDPTLLPAFILAMVCDGPAADTPLCEETCTDPECLPDACADAPEACALPDMVNEVLCASELAFLADCPEPAPVFTADAAGPYNGDPGQAIAIAATATGPGSEGTETCVWSGAGATFGDVNACSTTVTYATPGTYTITVQVTGAAVMDSDDATVNVADPDACAEDDVPCLLGELAAELETVPDMVLEQLCAAGPVPVVCDANGDPVADVLVALCDQGVTQACAGAPPTEIESCSSPRTTQARVCRDNTSGGAVTQFTQDVTGPGALRLEIGNYPVRL